MEKTYNKWWPLIRFWKFNLYFYFVRLFFVCIYFTFDFQSRSFWVLFEFYTCVSIWISHKTSINCRKSIYRKRLRTDSNVRLIKCREPITGRPRILSWYQNRSGSSRARWTRSFVVGFPVRARPPSIVIRAVPRGVREVRVQRAPWPWGTKSLRV